MNVSMSLLYSILYNYRKEAMANSFVLILYSRIKLEPGESSQIF